MTSLETSLVIAGLVLAGVAILFLIVVVLSPWLHWGADPELRAIRKEREENERSAGKAAVTAAEQMASASALGRKVRHVQRGIIAQARTDQHHSELGALTGGLPGGGAIGGPPPPPTHP